MIVIGIDPGLTGAISMVDRLGYRKMADMPVMQRGSAAAKVINQVNGTALADLLREWTQEYDKGEILVIIEQAQSMPAAVRDKRGAVKIVQGGASIFATGLTAGIIEGVVAAIGFPHRLVRASDWKKALKVTATKEQCRAFAHRLYPDADLRLKKHHNRAESLLIAHYGYQAYA